MKKLKVLCSAMGGNVEVADFLRPICEKLGYEYSTMSEWPSHDIKWELEKWLGWMREADIVVCAARHQIQPAKSANRAVQAMSLWKCVIASPLPAYLEVINHGVNGMICGTPEEWEAALKRLGDSGVRKQMGGKAKESVYDFSVQKIGAKWADLVKGLAFMNCDPPKVDIVIANYGALEHLKLCVESIRKNTDWPHNIIIVASRNEHGDFDWIRQQPDVIHVLSNDRMHFSQANNAGIKAGKEPYVCLLNDDTIVAKGWLHALMHEGMKPGVGAVGPFSNCDQGWLHTEDIVVSGKHLKPGMSTPDVQDIIPQIGNYTHEKEIKERRWVAFYCTLIPRSAIDKVGLLDEGFKSGDEDLDYCKRLKDAGYRILQTYNSFVFHFGGKTRKSVDEGSHEQHQREDQENHAYFMRKWGIQAGAPELRNETPLLVSRPRVLKTDQRPLFGLYTGQAWERWSPKSLDAGGIGGSETAAVHTALDFLRKGFRSVVFGDCEGMEGNYDGVEYIHHSSFPDFISRERFALFVSSRRADIFSLPIKADRTACVVHDIWLSPDGNAQLHEGKVSQFIVLSDWHKSFFLNHHKQVPRDKVVVSRDGVDISRFSHDVKRERGRMIYSSSPDRGLDVLLHALPRIRKEVPDASVHVFYGFENWEKACAMRGNKAELAWMGRIKASLDDPGVVYHGRGGAAPPASRRPSASRPRRTWRPETPSSAAISPRSPPPLEMPASC